MSTREEKNQRKSGQLLPKSPRKNFPLAVLFAALAVSASVLLLLLKSGDDAKPHATAINPSSPAVASAELAFLKLKGQWLRPDGGYILDISNVDAAGNIQAAYYNPNPIHVSKAATAREGETTTVFIELQDIGYPGSTYTLSYDPANDQLAGAYFQAALQQSFEVVFVRMK